MSNSFLAQVAGLVVLLLAMFGFDVPENFETDLYKALGVFGVLLTMVTLKIDEYREKKKRKNYHIIDDN